MMKLEGDNKDKESIQGSWYWITWDLSAPAYHGFVAGDVPYKAQSYGPSVWYVGERSYSSFKSRYVLHPGETLHMAMDASTKINDNTEGYRFGDKTYPYGLATGKTDYMFNINVKDGRDLQPGEFSQ